MVIATLVDRACGARHGVVAAPVVVPPAAADPASVVHASVPRDGAPWGSAGGGAARTPSAAKDAAVGEALERTAAALATVPVRPASAVAAGARIRLADCALHAADQRRRADFPYAAGYPDDEWLAETFELATNEPRWVPAALVSLSDAFGALTTSSGLAADPSVLRALLRAVQELVERDAYMTTWLHQLGGREVGGELAGELAPVGAEVQAYDLTPAFSPHPVAAVAATTWLAGRPRPSIGVACRATWEDAVEKAFLECSQGMLFVGHRLSQQPTLVGLAPEDVTGFDEHAVYYGANPDRWDEVPLRRHASAALRPPDSPAAGRGCATELTELVEALTTAGIRLYYRELTTVDVNQLGLRVVRVVAPELTPLHHDHRWPYLGGRAGDATWRYPDARHRAGGRAWPSPYPHALG